MTLAQSLKEGFISAKSKAVSVRENIEERKDASVKRQIAVLEKRQTSEKKLLELEKLRAERQKIKGQRAEVRRRGFEQSGFGRVLKGATKVAQNQVGFGKSQPLSNSEVENIIFGSPTRAKPKKAKKRTSKKSSGRSITINL